MHKRNAYPNKGAIFPGECTLTGPFTGQTPERKNNTGSMV